MPNPFNAATTISVQLATRNPGWRVQPPVPGPLTPPQSPSHGVQLDNAPATLVHVAVRELPHRRTVRLAITALTVGDTFTTTIDGTAVAYDSTGDADVDEALVGIAAAINANGTVSPLVTATAVDANDVSGTGNSTQVKIVGDSATDYSVDFTDDGSSTVTVSGDAQQCTVGPYWLMAGTGAPAQWANRDRQIVMAVDGFVERYPTGGFLRGYVHIDGLTAVPGDGSAMSLRVPDVYFGPGLPEGA